MWFLISWFIMLIGSGIWWLKTMNNNGWWRLSWRWTITNGQPITSAVSHLQQGDPAVHRSYGLQLPRWGSTSAPVINKDHPCGTAVANTVGGTNHAQHDVKSHKTCNKIGYIDTWGTPTCSSLANRESHGWNFPYTGLTPGFAVPGINMQSMK